MTRLWAAIALALSLVLPAAGLTDEAPDLAVGARVRVTASEVSRAFFDGKTDRRLVGTLFSFDDEALTIGVKNHEDPAVVPRSSIRQLEISRSPSKKWRGFLIGFLVGTGIGVGAAAINGGSSVCDSTSVSRCDLAVSAVMLGLPGAILGAVAFPGERWERVEAERAPVRVGIRPAPGGGVGISVGWSFGVQPQRPRLVPRRAIGPSDAGPPAPRSVKAFD